MIHCVTISSLFFCVCTTKKQNGDWGVEIFERLSFLNRMKSHSDHLMTLLSELFTNEAFSRLRLRKEIFVSVPFCPVLWTVCPCFWMDRSLKLRLTSIHKIVITIKLICTHIIPKTFLNEFDTGLANLQNIIQKSIQMDLLYLPYIRAFFMSYFFLSFFASRPLKYLTCSPESHS